MHPSLRSKKRYAPFRIPSAPMSKVSRRILTRTIFYCYSCKRDSSSPGDELAKCFGKLGLLILVSKEMLLVDCCNTTPKRHRRAVVSNECTITL